MILSAHSECDRTKQRSPRAAAVRWAAGNRVEMNRAKQRKWQ